jgi:hypothetical protein
MVDYYLVLGVPERASPAELRTAWHSKALECHPDRFRSAEEKRAAHDRFVELAEAYKTLSDENRRKAYDASRGLQPVGWKSDEYPRQDTSSAWREVDDLYAEIWKESTGRFVANTVRSGLGVLLVGAPFVVGGLVLLVGWVREPSGGIPWYIPVLLLLWGGGCLMDFVYRLRRVSASLRRAREVISTR